MERYFTSHEVAKLFHVHLTTVYNWIDYGHLPFIQFKTPHGRLFFRESDLKGLISTREEAQKRLKKLLDKKNAKSKSRSRKL